MKRSFILLFIFLFPVVFLGGLLLTNCKKERPGTQVAAVKTTGNHPEAEYTGRDACRPCHEKEDMLFRGSDHDMAMDTVNPNTVLGDFNDASFTHQGITSTFYTRDGRYYVNTEGPGGEMEEFEISYVFGIRPLQQYLVRFPGGRYQMLPLCWDTRPASQGGQRWFHIYGEERIPPDDVLFWTRIMQNWNYMCSECHSTNVRKQYDATSETYHTRWNEIDVSCEACHGPGSAHVAWAEHVAAGGRSDLYPDMGLVIKLKDTDQATWVFDMESGTANRSVPRTNTTMIDMCARCHARRSIITEDYVHGQSLMQTHWPALLEEQLYFPDGQILEEVYVYASFLQSKMFDAGVVCSDCHEPHSGKIFTYGNALCYRCHLAEKYGSRDHHFHRQDSTGALCYECHMHERTYMQIDPRRDHSIRVPRPDLSDKLGTPNACTQCHTDKTNSWAAGYLRDWYGTVEEGKTHYGEIFWAARRAYPEALEGLIDLAQDTESAPMIRATALSLLMNYPERGALTTLQSALADDDPLIRFASASAMNIADAQSLAASLSPLLSDSVKLVRILAARMLTTVPGQYLDRRTLSLREQVLEEYLHSQQINADHPSAHMNIGVVQMNLGDYAGAERSFKKAIEIEPGLMTSYVNLADLYRVMGRDEEGEEVLKTALELHPDLSAVHYAMGLLLVRKGQQNKALPYLKQAALLETGNARFAYVYGVALHSLGESGEAISFLESALQRHPYDRDILYTLATLHGEMGHTEKALEYAGKLVEYFPSDPSYRQLIDHLNSR